MNSLQAVKAMGGHWHWTMGMWEPGESRLRALCGRSVSPHHRRVGEDVAAGEVDCPKCLGIGQGDSGVLGHEARSR